MFFDQVKQRGYASMLRCMWTLFGYQNLPASWSQVLAFFADTSVKFMQEYACLNKLMKFYVYPLTLAIQCGVIKM